MHGRNERGNKMRRKEHQEEQKEKLGTRGGTQR
jgi:hypothetical protein